MSGMDRGAWIRCVAPAIGLLLAVGACGTRETPPPTVPPPAPPPAPERVTERDRPFPGLSVCVVDEQGMRVIQAQYDPATGDTLVEGRPFAEAYPTTGKYAEGAPWYIDNEPLEIDSLTYVRYGLPRVLRPGELVRGRDYGGVMTFTEADEPGRPYTVWYAAVRPNCEFQPYQWDLVGLGVRG